MAFGPKVRLFWSSADEDGSMTHAAIVIEPELAAALARELAEAALRAVEYLPSKRLVGISPDGTRVYQENR